MHRSACMYADTHRAIKLHSPSQSLEARSCLRRPSERFGSITLDQSTVPVPFFCKQSIEHSNYKQGNIEIISPLCRIAAVVSFAGLLSLTFTITLTHQELDSSPKLPSSPRNYCYIFLTIFLRDASTKTQQQEGKNTTLMEFLLWICDKDETNNTALRPSIFSLSLLRSKFATPLGHPRIARG